MGVKKLVKAQNVLTIRMVMNHTGGFPFEICAKQGNFKGGGWTGGAPLRPDCGDRGGVPVELRARYEGPVFQYGHRHRCGNRRNR